MPFIGNQPAESYSAFQKQDFSTSATTSYTLDHPVANQNEIALFINFVRQEPTTAYTASGTSLTLTSATASSDDMYCVYLGKAVQTVNPPSGSVGTAQLASEAVTNAKVASTIITGQTAETSIATDDTILIHDTSASALRKMTRANFVSGIGGTNTPAFQAKLTNSLSISDGTTVDVVFNSELYDVGSCYDTSNGQFTVPSGEAGKYLFGTTVFFTDGNGNVSDLLVYAHTTISSTAEQSQIARAESTSNGTLFTQKTLSSTFTLNLSVGDIVKIQAYADTNNGSATGVGTGGTPGKTIFYGYKIIE